MPARLTTVLAALAALLASCAKPPPEAYVQGTARSGQGAAIGTNAAGEACTEQAAGPARLDIFCGTWVQPSAEAARAEAGSPTDPMSFATASSWRAGLDQRFQCGPPSMTSILGGAPAAVMQCTRRIGGWPQVALAANVGGAIYYGDGVLPAAPVLERGIGVLSGRLQPGAAAPSSGMSALLASRLAAQAFRSGDVGQYEQLMNAGTMANLAENYAAAEQAFRAALAIQRKALGRDDPNSVDALMHLALQVSDQGRYAEADGLFARAQQLAPAAADHVAPARLLHYRALHALNQGRYEESLALLRQAEAAYSALLPPTILAGSAQAARPVTLSPLSITPDPQSGEQLLIDPEQRAALMGVLETRRYRAIVLRDLKRPAESEAALRSALRLSTSNGLQDRFLTARLYRTEGTTAATFGMEGQALSGLDRSVMDFRLALPGARPIAETDFLRAAELARAGDGSGALAACREGVAVLRRLRTGIRPALLEPCLDIYATQARSAGAQQQPILGEMFEAAQLAQDNLTAREIAQAAARLGENARDPRVGEAIRRQQDARQALTNLYRVRDAASTATAAGAPAAQAAELDKRITDAQTKLADADQELQQASPNYGQLVQDVVPTAEVQRSLAPEEAFAAITLSDTGGWTFAVRPRRIAVAKIEGGGRPRMAELVKRLRAGAEPTTTALPRYDVDAAHAIYADTLGRLEPQLEGVKALVVAPSGPLLSIPFGVLLTGPADADHLGEAPWLLRRFTIAHVPAASNFVALRKIAGGSRATQPWFGFGDFRPATLAQAERTFTGAECLESAKLFAGLPALPYSRRELEAARQLLGASAQDELLGAAFTAAAVRRAPLADFHVLHFATHGLLPAELKCESEPAIITSAPAGAPDANGALLTSSEITGLQLDADLVVLSACNSGGPGGAGTGGESLSGLARAFFYAGARAMMVTHWSVNDQAAAYLIADTLRRIRAGEGGGAASALHNAQLGMLAEAGKGLPASMAHPFFWGPFALIGNGTNAPVTAKPVISPRTVAGL
ncbi:MAG: CHAT domain-containing protein [Alphaproteobacteria bacterium]|nr:CHAT domain-containing protein [Alphaproteobacteria bacterium]